MITKVQDADTSHRLTSLLPHRDGFSKLDQDSGIPLDID